MISFLSSERVKIPSVDIWQIKDLLSQTLALKVACINISAAVSQNFYSLKQNIESFLGKECLDLGIWPSSATFVQIYIMSAYEWILMISSPKLWV